ncbi:group II intron maturase-specific domain-containing protein [Priestia filamentosa]|uniref:group II intron maturase-specific domain-containing protein n=1 Tax=Priestia filamentosa TaxID=1402861 RepID=UPI00397C36AA
MLRGRPVKEVINVLNTIVRRYGQYWKTVVAKKTFSYMDNYIFSKVKKHLRQLHSRKSSKWIAKLYFRKPHHGGENRWILICPLTKVQLLRISWTVLA